MPRFGFEQDHVISEKTDSAVRKEEDRRRSPDISEDVTENIEAGGILGKYECVENLVIYVEKS